MSLINVKAIEGVGVPVIGARLAIAALTALALTSCAPPGGDGGGQAGWTSGAEDPSAAATSPAAAFLPRFDDPRFQVRSLNIAALADPVGVALDLVETAMEDPKAPRRVYGDPDVPKRVTKAFHRSTYMVLDAITCLHETGHLELRGYTDVTNVYSAAVVLVVDGGAVRDADVALCALSSILPALPPRATANRPAIQPCAGIRRQGALFATWIGTTDWMCQVLNRQPGARSLIAPDRAVRSGDRGVDVTSLQFLLNEAGAQLTIDGNFGAATAAAVRTFQKCQPDLASSPSGVADQLTRKALADTVAAGQVSPACAGPASFAVTVKDPVERPKIL